MLVDRGNREVVMSTASNRGARFLEFGYSTLVRKSETDGDLAAQVWARPDIPRQHLLKLFADASEAVQSRFGDVDRNKAALLRNMVSKASEQIQAKSREHSSAYAAAEALVKSLHASGELSEAQLAEFARTGQFEETAVALSIMCSLPIAAVERVFAQGQWGHILVLAKAIGLAWGTTKTILKLKLQATPSPNDEIETLCQKWCETPHPLAALRLGLSLQRKGPPVHDADRRACLKEAPLWRRFTAVIFGEPGSTTPRAAIADR